MAGRDIVVIYHAIAADVLDNGTDQPVALVLVTEARQRIMIRMPRAAMVRLKDRIDATFVRPRRALSSR